MLSAVRKAIMRSDGGGSERASATAPTQKQAIEKAEKLDPKAAVLVERVRDTSVGGRDKWRKS
jgi:hypothetical protein